MSARLPGGGDPTEAARERIALAIQEQRDRLEQLTRCRAGAFYIVHGVLPDWAPPPPLPGTGTQLQLVIDNTK